MNREVEINEFLKFFAKVYIQNPHLQIKSDTFYSYLMNYDLSEDEKYEDVRFNFNKWIEHFRYNDNINVFHTNRQARFLQFQSTTVLDTKCVKLYVSFPKDKIFECVNKIFDYVAKNNMPTMSKVADIIRSDSVVIRLNRAEDAKKVMNFINNDIELSQACKKTNPFLMRNGKVGVAYDDMLSYNSTLSMILEQYFKYCRSNNRLNEVSFNTFKQYISNFYHNIFSNRDRLTIFLNNPEVMHNSSRFYDEGSLIVNYEQVIGLILESLNPNMNLEQYFNFYTKCLDEKNNQKMVNHYNQILKNNYGQNDISYSQEDVELLNSYIKYAEQKYGTENVARYLKSYVQNNLFAITRDNNYRNYFSMYLSIDKVLQITNNDIDGYVLNQLQKKETDNSFQNYNLFFDACVATYEKYGANQLYTAIVSSLKGDYRYFTNGNNQYRSALIKENFTSEIENYCVLIVKNYGNGMNSSNLYVDCTNAVMNFVREKSRELPEKKL